MKRFLIVLTILILCMAGLAAGGVAYLYNWASEDLPNFKQITDYRPPLVTTVTARDGRVLGHFYREKRFLVRLSEMSPYLPKAFLAAEDASFYEHEGIDLEAIARAFVKNLQAGSIVQGGSTITQQLIKRLLLTSEKSYERKIKEALLAYRLERYLSKDEILTIYLNQIFFGSHAYGVEAAARTYFGKHAKALTVAEAALLAGLPKAPSSYSPYNDPAAAKARQKYVLERMFELGWISQEEYDTALAEPLVYKHMDDPSWKVGAYYLEEVRRQLIEMFSEENAKAMGIELPKYGEDAVYELGLTVRTAVDLDHQAAAEAALKTGLEDSSRRRGWLGPVEHLEPEAYADFTAAQDVGAEDMVPGVWHQGLVTALTKDGADVQVGGFLGYLDVACMHWCREVDPEKATEEVPSVKDAREVLAVGDVVWVAMPESEEEEQKASSGPHEAGTVLPMVLKQLPEVQGALVSLEPQTGEVRALVGGYDFHRSQFNRAVQAQRQPGSAFKPIVYSAAMDEGLTPASMLLDAPFVYTDYDTGKVWRPENFEGVFYGPTLLRTALAKSRNLVTIRVAQKIGIEAIIKRAKDMGLDPEFPRNLSVSLGSVAVTPLDLCSAYTAFARGGSTIEPRMILSVEDAWGEELYLSTPVITDAVTPRNAYVMATLLKEVVQHGTGWRAKVLKRPVAGKTGTTNDEQDAWFMGFTPYLLTGVYVGFDQARPMGKYETGSRAASPIWVDYRVKVEENYPVQDFPEPPGISHVRIDAATGLLASPGSEETYFLPFYAGTEPVKTAETVETANPGEDILKLF